MLGWAAKKMQDSRVYMCVKVLKWDLEQSSQLRRSIILAMAHIVRIDGLNKSGIPLDPLDKPFSCSRSNLINLYSNLEDVRNESVMRLEQIKRQLSNTHMTLPVFAEEHIKDTNRGLEVWMCTIGAGITPDRRDDVRAIWSYLAGAIPTAMEGVRALLAVEQKTAAMTFMPASSMFQGVDEREWTESCKFVPSSFIRELAL